MRKFILSIILNIFALISTVFSYYFMIIGTGLTDADSIGLIAIIPIVIILSLIAIVLELFSLIPSILLVKSPDSKIKGKVMIAISLIFIVLAILCVGIMFIKLI